MDAILSLGVTKLVELLTSEKVALTVLSSTSVAISCCWPHFTTPRRASRSPAAGAGSAVAPDSARSGPAATCKSASAPACWFSP